MKLELAVNETHKINDPVRLKTIAITSLQNSIKIIESFEKVLKQQ